MNFEAGTIRAARSKSGEDYWVPMNDLVRATLARLPSRLRSPWVFPNRDGTGPIDAKNFIHRTFLPALRRAGIEDFH